MAIKTKVNGTWRTGTPKVKVNGVWRNASDVYTKVNGVWRHDSGGSAVQVDSKTVTATAGQSISFTGLLGEPTSFCIIAKANLSTGASPYKIASVVFDGSVIFGQNITNTYNQNMQYVSSGFSKTYRNGTLTVTAPSNANFAAISYLLIYSYGGGASDVHKVDASVGSGATQIAFTGLTAEPKYFSCVFKSNFGTSSGYARANAVARVSNNISGLYLNSQDVASTNSWTVTYGNGTLTIKSTSSSNGGYFHQPGNYQLTWV